MHRIRSLYMFVDSEPGAAINYEFHSFGQTYGGLINLS